MKMYDLIAENYSEIFPPDKERTEFVLSYSQYASPAMLDIGCATGDLCIDLARAGCAPVTGIDLNEKMISIAKDKAVNMKPAIDFRVMNMLEIEYHHSFGCVLCFGNTLPHLASMDEINDFFCKVSESLVPGGYFIFQILNYDRILSEKKVNFVTVENERFIFKREYEFTREDSIIFRIFFTDRSEGRTYSDSTRLLPVRRNNIVKLLDNSGFGSLNIYSDYNRTVSSMNEFASVYVAEKNDANSLLKP